MSMKSEFAYHGLQICININERVIEISKFP